MSPRTTTTAIAYLSALRLLAKGPMSAADLAKADNRVTSNIRRDTPKLVETGLIEVSGDTLVLTATGRLWVEGQDIAEGLAVPPTSPSAAPQRWPVNAIRPNPLNRSVTDKGIPALANAIIAAGDVLQPLLLTPPDANGVRTILAGERRWTAVQHLIREDAEALDAGGLCTASLPAALDEGIPFIEREADETEAMVITLLENSNRLDLTPWQDAQQLLKIAEATGWKGAELARRVGRPGSARDIQAKLKIAREATPEAIADYETHGSWDRLRDSVGKTKGPDNINLSLFLVEAAMRAEEEEGDWDATLVIDSGLHWPADWLKWFAYDVTTGHLSLTPLATSWLAGEGLGQDDVEVLRRHRRACGLTNRPALRPFVTPCLNWTPDQVADAEPGIPATEAKIEAEPNLPLPEVTAEAPQPEQGTEPPASTQHTAWRELVHKISTGALGMEGSAEVGAYWTFQDAIDLQVDRLVEFTPTPGASPRARLTQRGLFWARTLLNDDLTPLGTNYATPWLTPLEAQSPDAAARPAIAHQADIEDGQNDAVESDDQDPAGQLFDRIGRRGLMIAAIDLDQSPSVPPRVSLACHLTVDEMLAIVATLLDAVQTHATEGLGHCSNCEDQYAVATKALEILGPNRVHRPPTPVLQ